jgi:hypothetical protein
MTRTAGLHPAILAGDRAERRLDIAAGDARARDQHVLYDSHVIVSRVSALQLLRELCNPIAFLSRPHIVVKQNGGDREQWRKDQNLQDVVDSLHHQSGL